MRKFELGDIVIPKPEYSSLFKGPRKIIDIETSTQGTQYIMIDGEDHMYHDYALMHFEEKYPYEEDYTEESYNTGLSCAAIVGAFVVAIALIVLGMLTIFKI